MRLLSFDVEEWFHILNYDHPNPEVNWHLYPTRIETEISKILDILSSKNIKATFFCVGWVAAKYPKLIKKIEREGHQIGSHGYMHQRIETMTKKEFAGDLARSINDLEQIIGKKVICYRAPGFSVDKFNLHIFELLVENGIEIDSSIVSGSFPNDKGFDKLNISSPFLINVNGCIIKEFPIITRNMFFKKVIYSGGGYFRLWPYKYIKSWTESSQYVMAYFHYRDFDCDQSVLPNMTPFKRFKTYYGISRSLGKFKQYLNEFEFSSISEMNKELNWDKQQMIDIHTMRTC